LNALSMLSAGEKISEHKNVEIGEKVLSRLNKFGFNWALIAGSTLGSDPVWREFRFTPTSWRVFRRRRI